MHLLHIFRHEREIRPSCFSGGVNELGFICLVMAKRLNIGVLKGEMQDDLVQVNANHISTRQGRIRSLWSSWSTARMTNTDRHSLVAGYLLIEDCRVRRGTRIEPIGADFSFYLNRRRDRVSASQCLGCFDYTTTFFPFGSRSPLLSDISLLSSAKSAAMRCWRGSHRGELPVPHGVLQVGCSCDGATEFWRTFLDRYNANLNPRLRKVVILLVCVDWCGVGTS